VGAGPDARGGVARRPPGPSRRLRISPGYHGRVSNPAISRIVAIGVAVSTAVLIVGVAILPFMTPPWLAFAQDRAETTAWTGYTPVQVRVATDALVHDLILGPPEFAVEIDGRPVLGERERSHLRDVRAVFAGLGLLALVSAGVLLAALRWVDRTRIRRWMRRGALGLAAGTVVLGVIAGVAFDAAFEFFHGLLFAGGTWTFDPRTDRLVQLFPWRLWFETSLAAGGVIVAVSLGLAWALGRAPRSLPADAASRSEPMTATIAPTGEPR